MLIATPILIDLDEGFQIDGLVKELLQRLAGLGTHLLQGNTLMTNNDTLLGVTLHIDDGIDMDALVLLLKTLYTHLNRVGDLLVIVEENLLANDL